MPRPGITDIGTPKLGTPKADPTRWTGFEAAAAIIGELRGLQGALLPMLHALQDEFGYVPVEAEPMLADALNLSRAEVHGVISFYHEFRREPAGRHVLRLCRAEACQAAGGRAVADALLGRLQLDWGQRSGDGLLTVEPVYCLGLCACAPAAMLDGEPLGRITSHSLEQSLTECGT